MQFPGKIAALLSGEKYKTDDIGMSNASVLLFQDKVLKIQNDDAEAANEYRMMKWLHGKLAVPEVFAFESDGEKSWLLMSKCCGEASCTEKYMKDPAKQIKRLAEGLKALWQVDITDCPSENRYYRMAITVCRIFFCPITRSAISTSAKRELPINGATLPFAIEVYPITTAADTMTQPIPALIIRSCSGNSESHRIGIKSGIIPFWMSCFRSCFKFFFKSGIIFFVILHNTIFCNLSS